MHLDTDMTPFEALEAVRLGQQTDHALWRHGDGDAYTLAPPGIEPHYYQPDCERLETIAYLHRQLRQAEPGKPPSGSSLSVLLSDVRRAAGGAR